MQKEFQLQVLPEIASDPTELKQFVTTKFKIPEQEIRHIAILKRSIDARNKPVKINLKIRLFISEDFRELSISPPDYDQVADKEEVFIIGAGPSGLFGALKCIELGKKPIIFERGKDVRSRRKDLKAINIDHIVNEDSNYCFGEGGAGTYSDGKLYTRSRKRGDVNEILKLLVAFGASKEILVNTHPHIGTNKLPGIISKIREFILAHGGVIKFDTRVTDILINASAVTGIKTRNGDVFNVKKVVLATGHSARDIFQMLAARHVDIESKSFAIGVRVEHPQSLIDQIQYHCKTRSTFLPPAPYSIVKQVENRGVYSFCMCPGGIIAPCATSPGEVVTNGWSPSKRDQATANSGIVMELKDEDFKKFEEFGPLAAMMFQQSIERKAWAEAGRTQRVPAQRLVDFVNGCQSKELPTTSYKPGVTSVELGSIFPEFINSRLQEGFKKFGKSMKGYLTNEAIVHAPESRTSSPVRIPRDPESLEHIRVKGLYPAGEGAGYAGGIISAALDGMNCVAKCVTSMEK